MCESTGTRVVEARVLNFSRSEPILLLSTGRTPSDWPSELYMEYRFRDGFFGGFAPVVESGSSSLPLSP